MSVDRLWCAVAKQLLRSVTCRHYSSVHTEDKPFGNQEVAAIKHVSESLGQNRTC